MPDDITIGELNRRLERLEAWTHSFETKVDAQYRLLQTSIATLSFVSKDVYHSEMQAVKESIASVRAIAMWALGCVAAVVIGAVLASIIGLGGVFK